MIASETKFTDELDSQEKGQELPPLGNKQGQDRIGSGKYSDTETDSSSYSQRDYGPVLEQDELPVHLQLCKSKVKPAELILFTTQLSVMLDSGVVLSDALDAIAEQAEYGTFKMVIIDVAETVKNGDDFSRALAEYPKIFNKMFISMVKASEASGRMAEMLNVLSGYLNFESETRKRIKGALTYPFIMALMAVAATGTLMFFVLPRFMRIYESKGAALPKITQVVVGFSRFIGDFQSMTIFLTGLILTSVGLYYFSGTLTGRRVIDFIKIRTPVLGTMFIDTIVTRSMRIMATMLNTGVNLMDSIVVIQGSCDNYYFRQLWTGVNDKIRDGYQLSESIMISPSSQLMAPGIIQMLKAGEKSGKLGEVCDKISVFYEKKLESSIRNVMALIEPIMITILGCVIGTIAIALLLPVFRISNVIAH
ncbi:MAG: type II secretion system F family protein [Planctomycetes bacterium]|nr:type II secretion system F family protein [Planctomycetota bacterium]MBL7142648.1 type II secretion system F family protein [Phycisphaerae bacterium]